MSCSLSFNFPFIIIARAANMTRSLFLNFDQILNKIPFFHHCTCYTTSQEVSFSNFIIS